RLQSLAFKLDCSLRDVAVSIFQEQLGRFAEWLPVKFPATLGRRFTSKNLTNALLLQCQRLPPIGGVQSLPIPHSMDRHVQMPMPAAFVDHFFPPTFFRP